MKLLIHPTSIGISQGFGQNYVSFYAELGMKGHNGIDYQCPHGSNVIAPCDMDIVDAYYENKDAGYGTTVWGHSKSWLENGSEYKLEMVFGHLHDFLFKKGSQVKMGEIIAITDNTGKYTTGSHLHFGVRVLKKVGGNWKLQNENNGYKGYVDPKQFMITNFVNDPLRLFKAKSSKAVYILTRNSQYMEVIDENIILQLVGEWSEVKPIKLKVDLQPQDIYDVLANARFFKKVYKVK